MKTFTSVFFEKIAPRAYKKLHDACREIAGEWKEFLVMKMEAKDKTGRKYFNIKTGQMYTASSGGKIEYPARKSPPGTDGFLDKLRIFVGYYNDQAKSIRININSGAVYTKFLMDTRKLFVESKEEWLKIAKLRLLNIPGVKIKS